MNVTVPRRQLHGLPIERLLQEARATKALRRFEIAIKQRGTLDRLWHIAEHGASPEDMDWIEQQSKETGFDFHAVVAACVELNEEY